MKKQDFDEQLGPIMAMHCRCSVWPIVIAAGRIGRCGECGVRPQPIPAWEEGR